MITKLQINLCVISKNKETKVMPRKKAQLFNISNTVDRGDGEYEENTLPDGKVNFPSLQSD